MFCPKCKGLMVPKDDGYLCRKCGYSTSQKGKSEKIVTKMEVGPDMMVIEGDTATLPKTRAKCEKCGHNEAYYVIRQTRAADEPETRIYRCTKCEHTWREY